MSGDNYCDTCAELILKEVDGNEYDYCKIWKTIIIASGRCSCYSDYWKPRKEKIK